MIAELKQWFPEKRFTHTELGKGTWKIGISLLCLSTLEKKTLNFDSELDKVQDKNNREKKKKRVGALHECVCICTCVFLL